MTLLNLRFLIFSIKLFIKFFFFFFSFKVLLRPFLLFVYIFFSLTTCVRSGLPLQVGHRRANFEFGDFKAIGGIASCSVIDLGPQIVINFGRLEYGRVSNNFSRFRKTSNRRCASSFSLHLLLFYFFLFFILHFNIQYIKQHAISYL